MMHARSLNGIQACAWSLGAGARGCWWPARVLLSACQESGQHAYQAARKNPAAKYRDIRDQFWQSVEPNSFAR